METRVSDACERATFAADGFGSIAGQMGPRNFSHANIADRGMWFAIMCKALWGEGATAALFDLVVQHLGYEDERNAERQCRRWASGHSEPPQSILWMLIRSKEGFRVIRYISEHGRPSEWWLVRERERELAAMAIEIFERLSRAVTQ
jgi:hypothetical protein